MYHNQTMLRHARLVSVCTAASCISVHKKKSQSIVSVMSVMKNLTDEPWHLMRCFCYPTAQAQTLLSTVTGEW